MTLESSIRSLFSLAIAYEILIFLNNCTDRSAAIAGRLGAENPRIRIFEYNHSLSRPGIETLATDAESIHSFVRFSNWGLQYTSYLWKVRWDADFFMNDGLRTYLEAQTAAGLWARSDSILRLPAVGLDGDIERGDYFASCLDHYRKEVFWEVPAFRFDSDRILRIEAPPGVNITHVSRINDIKPYWSEPGWYEKSFPQGSPLPSLSLPEATGNEKGEYEEGIEGNEAQQVQKRIGWIRREFGYVASGMGRSGTLEEATHLAHRILEKYTHIIDLQYSRVQVPESRVLLPGTMNQKALQLFWGPEDLNGEVREKAGAG